jgi:hypothetical protein
VSSLAVSADGTIVDFYFDISNNSQLRFDLNELKLKLAKDWQEDVHTLVPQQSGLAIEDWRNSENPKLDGNEIELSYPLDRARSLAISPSNERFVLGTDFKLLAIDARGALLWQRDVPNSVWGVNAIALTVAENYWRSWC